MRAGLITLLLMASLGAQAHPLDGQWWDVKAQRFSDEKSVQARATAARYVLLGEKHDSDIHHAEQLAMLQALVSQGWRGALAMEQFDQLNQAALTAAQQTGARDADTPITGNDNCDRCGIHAVRNAFQTARRRSGRPTNTRFTSILSSAKKTDTAGTGA